MSNDLVARIKEIKISTIIGNYIQLKKSGAHYLGVCPFHDDHKPSLTVNDNKNMFMCFACDTGGDAINFVERYKKLEFKDALKEICRVSGIRHEDYIKGKTLSPKFEMAKRVLQKAAQIYYKSGQSKSFQEYNEFLVKRNLKPESVKEFLIGYASNNNPILSYLETIPNQKEKEEAIKVALELFLLRRDEKSGRIFDSFRDRVMFPIFDAHGVVVGFGGRAVFESQKAKYINSQESFFFQKKNIVFGYHLAKGHIREKDHVIFVEGYMDMISMWQAGFKNCVAVMGIAMNEQIIDDLGRITKRFYLGLDSDNAGMKAMERINELMLKAGIIPNLLDYSPAKDPDDFLMKEGALNLEIRLKSSRAFLDFLIDRKVSGPIPETYEKKLAILKDIFLLLTPLKTDLSATERILDIAKKLGLKSENSQIIESYKNFLNSLTTQNKTTFKIPKEILHDNYSSNNIEELQKQESYPVAQNEKQQSLDKVLRLLIVESILHPRVLTFGKITELLDLVDNDEVKRYLLRLKEIALEVEASDYLDVILAFTSSTSESFLVDIKTAAGSAVYRFKEDNLNDEQIALLRADLCKRLKEYNLQQQTNKLIQLHNNASTEDEQVLYANEIFTIKRELEKLKTKKLIKKIE